MAAQEHKYRLMAIYGKQETQHKLTFTVVYDHVCLLVLKHGKGRFFSVWKKSKSSELRIIHGIVMFISLMQHLTTRLDSWLKIVLTIFLLRVQKQFQTNINLSMQYLAAYLTDL